MSHRRRSADASLRDGRRPVLRGALAWIAAIMLASVAPALVFAAAAFDGRIVPGRATGTAFVLGLLVALGHVLLLGVPVAIWLRSSGRFSLLRLLLAGFVAGLVPCLLLLLLQTQATPAAMAGLLNPVVGLIVLAAGGFGVLAAFVFWGVLRLALPSRRA